MNNNELLTMANKAMQSAYSPYSCFKVGAAILTDDGSVYTGCNIENSSFGATICAERTAAVKAVSEGHTKFRKIAVTGSANEFTYPCGICRQFLSEFVTADCSIILEDKDKGITEIPFTDFLPYAFTADCIK